MYRLYYHPACPSCRRMAKWTERLDWLNRFELSTHPPPTGTLEPGEVLVLASDGTCYTRARASRVICLNIPLYFVFGLLLSLSQVLRWASRKSPACRGQVGRPTDKHGGDEVTSEDDS